MELQNHLEGFAGGMNSVEPGAHYCFITQRWDVGSSTGCPVVGVSECDVCGKKADEADWRAWQERNKWKLTAAAQSS